MPTRVLRVSEVFLPDLTRPAGNTPVRCVCVVCVCRPLNVYVGKFVVNKDYMLHYNMKNMKLYCGCLERCASYVFFGILVLFLCLVILCLLFLITKFLIL